MQKNASERPVPCTAVEVRPGIFRFDDDTKASFYLIVGKEAAAAIDTGLSEGALMPVLRRYTDLPITLLVTHGHGDHISHADEFETVYMSPADIPFLSVAAERLGLKRPLDPERFQPLYDRETVRVGDIELEVFAVPGHSVGSVVFYDRKDNLMFSGDAFGSGWAVFMQLPGGAQVAEYRKSLHAFLERVEAIDPEPEFLTGHFAQRETPDGDNPVCFALIRDMEALCGELLAGKTETKEVSFFAHSDEPELLARYGRASMVTNRSKLQEG